MYCKKCGSVIDDDSDFCQNCGADLSTVSAQDYNEYVDPAVQSEKYSSYGYDVSQNSKKTIAKNISIFIIIICAFVLAFTFYNSSKDNSSSETVDYKELTHECAVESMKIILENSDISKYDHLGWYYDELYKEENGIHYSTSKLDYSGSDHTYTIGITYDSKNKPTCVFAMIDDMVVLDERE